jgi:hypothetical protein
MYARGQIAREQDQRGGIGRVPCVLNSDTES